MQLNPRSTPLIRSSLLLVGLCFVAASSAHAASVTIGDVASAYTGSISVSTQLAGPSDLDADGDVDNADIGAVIGTFGVSAAGNLTDSGIIADLIYDPLTGNVKFDASEAQNVGTITTFQLENFNNTFIPANYIPVTGGTFNGGFKNVTTSVIADSDFTFAGFSGIKDLGNVFPTGLTQTGLQAYLKTAVYTGSLGSGQQQFDLVLAEVSPIPEPSSFFAIGALCLGGVMLDRRRRR